YTGATNVSAGTLKLSGNGALVQSSTTNAVQTVSLQKVASGTFTLTFNGQPTAAITYSTTPATTAANIQTQLAALANTGRGNVSVTALSTSGANNQYFLVTFQGALGGAAQPTMSINTASLAASANIVLGSVSTTTAGSAGLTINTGGTVTLDNTGTN